MAKTMAMHQPNYVPWLGYFHKLARCDVFVYLDAVQFPRGQSFGARNRIKTPNGVAWLTIPVARPHGRDGKVTYAEVGFADEGWREKHLKTVEMSYRKAPHFDQVFAALPGRAVRGRHAARREPRPDRIDGQPARPDDDAGAAVRAPRRVRSEEHADR